MIEGHVLANIISPPNGQREDTTWNWAGIRITGNSQCQGNANEDLLKGIGIEFGIKGLENINTYNYYAMFFGFLHSEQAKNFNRTDLMWYLNHVEFMNSIFINNDLPVRAKALSAIGDKGVQKFSGNCSEIHQFLQNTKRQISLGTTLTGPGGHWIRIDESHLGKMYLGGNDSFGTHPYKTDIEKKMPRVRYSYEQMQGKIRRAIILEDIK